MKYLKRFNESINESKSPEEIIDITNYINSNLIIYGCKFEDQIGILTTFEFNYNGDELYIIYSRNLNSTAGTIIEKNDKETLVTKKSDLKDAIKNYINIYRIIINIIGSMIHKDLEESVERIEEFDVIKGDKIDLISLESLCSYYKSPFPKEYVVQYLTKYHIKYIG